MKYKNIHRWDLSPKEAIRLQKRIQKKIIIKKLNTRAIRFLAGVDVSVKNDRSRAAIVVLSYPRLEKVETAVLTLKTSFPYIPGLLSFRERPVILECVKKLKTEPDLFIFDGQGMAHPRRTGLASHIGVIFDKPSIGSAKSHLYGTYALPGNKKGDFSLIKDKDGTDLGAVVRSRDNTNPIFVSPGHRADILSSVKVILSCCVKYKIPEPIRAAHNAASLR
ncbi:MAG: deoxyribonuclease V [Candidatus Omnitrophota bacterium]|nr:deoxyribonuclease V [Candidatus Omnitrophota bacterium]